MDFTDIRLVPPRIAGDLHMRVMPGERAHLGRQIALHDLHMIEVELELQVRPPDPLDDAQGLAGVVQEIARDVACIDRLDDRGEARRRHAVGGPAQIVDIDPLTRFLVTSLRPQPRHRMQQPTL